MEQLILLKFRDSLVQFIDSLIEQLDSHPTIKGDLIALRVFTKDQIPMLDVMNAFIAHILPHKEMIEKRRDAFFIENVDSMENLSGDSVERFKKLWRSNTFTEDDRSTIWDWVDVFVKLGEKYQIVKLKN